MNISEITLKPGTKKAISADISAKTKILAKLEAKLEDLTTRHNELKISFPDELLTNKKFMAKIEAAQQEIQQVAAKVQEKILAVQQSIEDEKAKVRPSKFIDKLKTECSEYIAACLKSGKFLYRGTYGAKDIFMGMPRNNRQTKDSSEGFQAIFDQILRDKGFTAVRSNSIFCISDFDVAGEYGDEYIIFPINGFSFTWSKTKEDIAMSTSELETYMVKGSETKIYKALIKQANAYGLAKYKKHWDDFTEDVYGLSSLESELIDHFYYHNGEDKNHTQDIAFVHSLLAKAVSPTKFLKEFKPDNQDLAMAVATGHEVYIHGPYYAIRADKYHETLSNALGIPGDGHAPRSDEEDF